jgi:hypothetical protein
MRMRGITLWQPYASALFAPHPHIQGFFAKVHETRGWPMQDHVVDQWVFIHAAVQKLSPAKLGSPGSVAAGEVFGGDWRDTLPFGQIIGKVRFGRSCQTEVQRPFHHLDRLLGDWSFGRYATPVIEREKFETPIPAKGAQGWWFADV